MANYGSLLSNLAIAYVRLGQVSLAKELFDRSVELFRNIYGPESIDYAISLGGRSDCFNVLARYDDAKRDALAAVAILDRATLATASRANAYHRLGYAELD